MAQLVEYKMMHALLSDAFCVELSTAVSDNNNNNDIDSHLTTVNPD